jgi:hypothetical protein
VLKFDLHFITLPDRTLKVKIINLMRKTNLHHIMLALSAKILVNGLRSFFKGVLSCCSFVAAMLLLSRMLLVRSSGLKVLRVNDSFMLLENDEPVSRIN